MRSLVACSVFEFDFKNLELYACDFGGIQFANLVDGFSLAHEPALFRDGIDGGHVALLALGKCREISLASQGGKDFELVFERFFKETFDDEFGNPFLRNECLGDVLVVAELPVG